MSADVEALIYQHAIDLGITLLTISHRQSIFRFHDFILRLDGQGGYEFRKIEESDLNLQIAGTFERKPSISSSRIIRETQDELICDDRHNGMRSPPSLLASPAVKVNPADGLNFGAASLLPS